MLNAKVHKYPLQAPPEEVWRRVQCVVQDFDPPRYEDQLQKKKTKQTRTGKLGEEEEDCLVQDADEVIDSMEKMCIREAKRELKAGYI